MGGCGKVLNGKKNNALRGQGGRVREIDRGGWGTKKRGRKLGRGGKRGRYKTENRSTQVPPKIEAS